MGRFLRFASAVSERQGFVPHELPLVEPLAVQVRDDFFHDKI